MTAKSQTAVKTEARLSLNTDKSGLLQRKCECGNAAGLMGQCTECRSKRLTKQTATLTQNGSAPILHDLIQPKLRIGSPDDKYEQEADRIAEQIMVAPAYPVSSGGVPPRIQRYTGESNDTETVSASVDRALASPGKPLDPKLQWDMEQRFGHDFSQVRIHTDRSAEQSARELNANAYTVRHNIVFGAGQYAPEMHEGRRLIAHELTHTIQQNAAINLGVNENQGELSAIRGELVQRDSDYNALTLDDHLSSPRFIGDQILSACFQDRARLGEGATGPAVAKIQAALLDLGYDLGPTGADGKFGSATAAAVRAFKKTERLGFEQYGDVGPGTMRRLDRIFAGESSTAEPVTLKAVGGESPVREQFVVVPLAPPNAVQIPPDEDDCPPEPVAIAFNDATDPIGGFGPAGPGDPCLMAPAPPGAISDFEADLRKNPGRIMGVVIDPDNPDEIIGYRVRTDSTILMIVDREGNYVGGNEKSLDKPMLDPIDFIPTPGTIVKGTVVVGKVGLKVLGKLATKKVAAESLWKVSASTIPKLRAVSMAMLGVVGRAKAKDIPKIALRVTEGGLEHSFKQHAAEWFGRTVPRETHFEVWRQLVERASTSSLIFPFSAGTRKTIAKLATIEGKPFIVQFAEDTGELVTAFVPSQRKMKHIRALLEKMK